MTVLTFPPKQRPAEPDRDIRRPADMRPDVWCDERARLRLVTALQRSLVEGLLARGPGAADVLRAFR